MGQRTRLILAAAVISAMMAGCSKNQNGNTLSNETGAETGAESAVQQDQSVNQTEKAGNILIAYFSVPETDGTDTEAGASRVAVDGEVLGNTQYVAQLIGQETGGDLFRIETIQEYPGTHDQLLGFAYEELAKDTRPELASKIENLDGYDTIFLGYPNWNAELPMPLYTFLEETDLSGKTIIPFVTHGGSGFSRTVQTFAQLQPEAEVLADGLSISRNAAASSADSVSQWVDHLGLRGQ